MDNVIEQKANAFLSLADHPLLLILFFVMLVMSLLGTVVIVIAKTNPNLFNRLLGTKKNSQKNEIIKRADSCGNCIKSTIEPLKLEMDKLIKLTEDELIERTHRQKDLDLRLDTMTKAINNNMITSGLAAIYNDNLPYDEFLDIIFNLWRNSVNGNSIDRSIYVIMKNDGRVTFNSKLSRNIRENGEGSKQFQECIDKVKKGLV